MTVLFLSCEKKHNINVYLYFQVRVKSFVLHLTSMNLHHLFTFILFALTQEWPHYMNYKENILILFEAINSFVKM